MTDFYIKELSFADYDLLQGFWNHLKSPAIESEFLDLKGSIKSMNLELKAEGSIILGEISENRIRGFAFLDLLDIARGWLSFLIVLPEYRRKGIGSALYKKSEEIFKLNHKSTVRVPIYKITTANQIMLDRNQYSKFRKASDGITFFEKRL